MIMRWVMAIFLVAIGFYLLRNNSSRHLAFRRLLFVLFITAGLASLIFRDSWTKLSNFMGVESGTSLLTYMVTFAFIAYVISTYRWKREMENRFIILTREISKLTVKDPHS
jgi:uncharacterized membrane protein